MTVRRAAAALVAILVGAASVPAQAPAAGRVTISGVVVDERTNGGIKDVLVVACRAAVEEGDATTAADGTYTLTVPAGPRILTIHFTEDPRGRVSYVGRSIQALAGHKDLVINKALAPMAPRPTAGQARAQAAVLRGLMENGPTKWAAIVREPLARQIDELAVLSRGLATFAQDEVDRSLFVLERERVALALSPDDRVLYLGDRLGRMAAWDLERREPQPLLADMVPTTSMASGSDGALFCAVPGRELMSLGRTGSRQQGGVPPRYGSQNAVVASREDRFAAAGDGGAVVLFRNRGGQALVERTLPNTVGSVRALAFSPDERWLAAVGVSGAAAAWRTDTGQEAWYQELPTGIGNALAFAPNGRDLAVATGVGAQGAVHVLDAESGGVKLSFGVAAGAATAVAYTASGEHLLVGSQPQAALHVFVASSGKPGRTIAAVREFVPSRNRRRVVVLRPDGKAPEAIDVGRISD